MSIADLFSYKSPKQKAREMQAYRLWAFPYGEPQKKAVTHILSQLVPDEYPEIALATYLIGKEAYFAGWKNGEDTRTPEQKLSDATEALRHQLSGKKRKVLPYYLALIQADETIDERLAYPSVAALQEIAQSL